MKANIKSIKDASNTHNYGNDKELTGTMNVIGIKKGILKEVITVRWYMGRSKSASVVYCTIWVHGNGVYGSGSGSAGGGGYDKGAAALAYAIEASGIKLPEEIGRRERMAVEAICVALGYKKTLIVRN